MPAASLLAASSCTTASHFNCAGSPLGSSPGAVVDAVPGLTSADSAASSLCSEPCSEDEGGAPCSIELAARGAAGQLAPTEVAGRLGPSSSSSGSSVVRARAAFFEALIRCNTTAHIQCSADGACCATCSGIGDSGQAVLDTAPAAVCNGSAAAASQATAAQALAQQPWGDDGYSEVQLVVRMPRAAPAPGGGRYGSIGEMEALIEQLQGLLEVKERQRQAAVDAYNRRVSMQSVARRGKQDPKESEGIAPRPLHAGVGTAVFCLLASGPTSPAAEGHRSS